MVTYKAYIKSCVPIIAVSVEGVIIVQLKEDDLHRSLSTRDLCTYGHDSYMYIYAYKAHSFLIMWYVDKVVIQI